MMDTRGPPVKLSPEPIYSVAGNEGDMWPFFPGVIKIGNLKKNHLPAVNDSEGKNVALVDLVLFKHLKSARWSVVFTHS